MLFDFQSAILPTHQFLAPSCIGVEADGGVFCREQTSQRKPNIAQPYNRYFCFFHHCLCLDHPHKYLNVDEEDQCVKGTRKDRYLSIRSICRGSLDYSTFSPFPQEVHFFCPKSEKHGCHLARKYFLCSRICNACFANPICF